MTQEKTSSPQQWPFGFTGWDIIRLLVALGLIIGLIPTRWWVVQRPVEPPPTSSVAPTPSEAAVVSPTKTPAPVPTNTPTEESTTTLAPQPIATSTSTLIKTPTATSTTAPPTFTPTQAPPTSAPPTITPSTPTATSTLLPTATPTPPTPSSTPPPPPTEKISPAPLSTPKPATIIYVQSNGGVHTLGIVTSDGVLVPRAFPTYAAAPAWSYDDTIAFIGEEGILGPGNTQGVGVWIIPQSGIAKQLVSAPHTVYLTASPDRTRLAFEVSAPDVQSEIRIIDARTGSEVTRFPGQEPAYSPDGEILVVRRGERSSYKLYFINADGSGQQEITFSEANSHYPSWSPDGQYLAFSDDRQGNWEIILYSLMTREWGYLTNHKATDTTPVFSPDGQETYWLSDRDGGWKIMAMRLDGSGQRVVKDGIGDPPGDWGLARPTIH